MVAVTSRRPSLASPPRRRPSRARQSSLQPQVVRPPLHDVLVIPAATATAAHDHWFTGSRRHEEVHAAAVPVCSPPLALRTDQSKRPVFGVVPRARVNLPSPPSSSLSSATSSFIVVVIIIIAVFTVIATLRRPSFSLSLHMVPTTPCFLYSRLPNIYALTSGANIRRKK